MVRRRAVSLLELMGTLTILGLLALMSCFYLPWGRATQQPRALAFEFSSWIDDLRSRAQARQCPTALVSAGQDWLALEGQGQAHLSKSVSWVKRFPGLSFGVAQWQGGVWAWDEGGDSWRDWARPWSELPTLIFTPGGTTIGLNWPLQNGRFVGLVSQGWQLDPASLGGFPLPQVARVHRAEVVTVSQVGACEVLPSGQLAHKEVAQPLPADPTTRPTLIDRVEDFEVTEVLLRPQQNPEALGSKSARVEAEDYLHLTIKVKGQGKLPLLCGWEVAQSSSSASQGTLSGREPLPMQWEGDHFESTWEWQCPPSSQPNDQFTLRCSVTDGAGKRLSLPATAEVRVEVIQPSRLMFSSTRSGNPELYMCNRDGSRLKRLTYSAALEGRSLLSPDGSRMAYTLDGQLWLADAQGRDPQLLCLSESGSITEPSWNPLGTQLVFVLKGAQDQLCVVDADPQNPRRPSLRHRELLTSARDSLGFCDWHLDNRRIVFDQSNRLQEYLLSENRSRPLGPLGTGAFQARFSPDGERIIFTRRPDIWLADFRVGPNQEGILENARALVQTGPWNSDPFWSPDGAAIVFGSRRPGGDLAEERIWIQPIQASETQARKISLSNARDWDPTWGR